jgi:hypothetical protein
MILKNVKETNTTFRSLTAGFPLTALIDVILIAHCI